MKPEGTYSNMATHDFSRLISWDQVGRIKPGEKGHLSNRCLYLESEGCFTQLRPFMRKLSSNSCRLRVGVSLRLNPWLSVILLYYIRSASKILKSVLELECELSSCVSSLLLNQLNLQLLFLKSPRIHMSVS